jgi:hypothetical protein
MLRLVFVAICFAAIPGLAHAAETPCGMWETSVTTFAGEGEGLNAHFCTEAPAQILSFEITCDANVVSIRFMPQDFDDVEIPGNREVKLDYVIDGTPHVVKTQFEELDGAFAGAVDKKDPLIAALTTGKSLKLSLKQKKVSDYTTTLKGSGKAFRKLLRECGR